MRRGAARGYCGSAESGGADAAAPSYVGTIYPLLLKFAGSRAGTRAPLRREAAAAAEGGGSNAVAPSWVPIAHCYCYCASFNAGARCVAALGFCVGREPRCYHRRTDVETVHLEDGGLARARPGRLWRQVIPYRRRDRLARRAWRVQGGAHHQAARPLGLGHPQDLRAARSHTSTSPARRLWAEPPAPSSRRCAPAGRSPPRSAERQAGASRRHSSSSPSPNHIHHDFVTSKDHGTRTAVREPNRGRTSVSG